MALARVALVQGPGPAGVAWISWLRALRHDALIAPTPVAFCADFVTPGFAGWPKVKLRMRSHLEIHGILCGVVS